jgi:hypothetical protein
MINQTPGEMQGASSAGCLPAHDHEYVLQGVRVVLESGVSGSPAPKTSDGHATAVAFPGKQR